MRLIDADALLSCIMKSREKNPHKDSKIRANHTIEHDHTAHLVLEQPTAYDPEEVCKMISENRDMDNMIDADHAIKIVKQEKKE